MPIIKIKDSSLIKKVVHFMPQLKCSIKDEEIRMNDLGRIDLFTEAGIKRQILCLLGYRNSHNYLEKCRAYSKVLISSSNCFEVHFNDNLILSKFITQEYISTVNHYFGRKIRLLLSGNSLICESRSPILASFIYKAIFADIYDDSIHFKNIRFFLTKKALKEVLTKRDPLFLDCDNFFNYFGSSINNKDIVNGLEKFGYKVISFVKGRGYLILPPFFRSDVYSESDILEDIMLLNLNKFKGDKEIRIKKRIDENNDYDNSTEIIFVRNLLNFGFKELSLFSHKGLPLITSIKKEVLFRSSIIPSLLNYEISNQHIKYPHRLFEVGTVLNDLKQDEKLGILISQTDVDFNELYSIIYYIILSFFDKEISLKENNSEYYEKGTSFDIIDNKNRIGIMGILSSQLARKIGLKTQCLCLELDLKLITKII